jgi:hypothetical protein
MQINRNTGFMLIFLKVNTCEVYHHPSPASLINEIQQHFDQSTQCDHNPLHLFISILHVQW